MGLDPGMFAAIGMVAMLASAANAPLAASVMAIELFGPGIGPYAAIAAIVAFIMSGHRSVYPSQVLGMPKTRSLEPPPRGGDGRRARDRRSARTGALASVPEDARAAPPPPARLNPRRLGYLGQIHPAPLGLGKQPTDCGRSCFGSHSTTSGNSTVKAMVMKNTM